ncbi:MAG: hypothetical protein ABEH90_08870 [Halolamina sp.]
MRSENPVDDLETLLAPRRRRSMLYCLLLYANPLELADVAHQVAEWEFGADAEEFLQKRLRVYASLYHDHLPALEAADLVEYSQCEDVVELGPRTRAAKSRIRELVTRER